MLHETDPRHGTYAGANQHWITRTPMCDPCADAAFKYAKRRKRDGDRLIPSYRATRRRDALYALGWSARQIAEAGGTTTAAIHQAGKRDTITPAAFEAVDRAFEALSMTLPEPSPYVTRNKNNAARDGLIPPLGWLDIDDEDEQPTDWAYRAPATRADIFDDLLARAGSLTELLRELDTSRDALEKWAVRNGYRDDFNRLSAADRMPTVYRNQHTKEAS